MNSSLPIVGPRLTAVCGALAVCCFLAPTSNWAAAASGAAQEPAASVSSSVEESALVSKTTQKYRSLKTYQDRMSLKFTMVSKDEDGDGWPQKQSSEGTFAFARPNRLALLTDQATVVCDGVKLWTYIQQFGQYTVSDAPEKVDPSSSLGTGPMGPVATHPITMLHSSKDKDLADIFPMVKSIDRAKTEDRDGRPGHRLHGMLVLEMMPTESPQPFSVWLDGETGLILEVRVDMSEAYKQMTAE